MKKLSFLLMVVLLGFMFVGCSGDKAETKIIEQEGEQNQVSVSGDDERIKIALVMKTLTNPFFIEMENGARKAQEEFDVDLIVKTGAQETSIDQQIDIVENMIAEKVDAIVIAPGSSTELIPVLKKAQDAGIAVVNIDNQLDIAMSEKLGLVNVPFVSVDNVEGAYLSAKYVADMLTEPTKVAIIEGITTAKNSKDRKDGAAKAFEECANVSSIVYDAASWKIDESYAVTKKLYQENPDIKAIFCANDMMALGTIQYLTETGKTGVLVASFDALEEAKEAILEGKMISTIDQQANLQGYEGIKCAIDLIRNIPVAQKQIIDVRLVTAETLK